MNIIIFKHIHSAFHPEAGTYFCGDKFHQLRYFIRMLNDRPKIVFVLGEHGDFYEGGIATRSRYCPVRTQKNIKPKNIEWIFHLGRCQVLFHL